MKKPQLTFVTLLCIMFAVTFLVRADYAKNDFDQDLVNDLALLQGSWQLLHGNDDNGPPNIRSVRIIKGNMETLRRYDFNTGKLLHEHRVGFILTKSGTVRVLTFFPVGDNPPVFVPG